MAFFSVQEERRHKLVLEGLVKWNFSVLAVPFSRKPRLYVAAFLSGLRRISRIELNGAWNEALKFR